MHLRGPFMNFSPLFLNVANFQYYKYDVDFRTPVRLICASGANYQLKFARYHSLFPSYLLVALEIYKFIFIHENKIL